ncbi:hypothetical protein HH308_06180 [Gordonia sp. TBRC 11910]|uniref:Uncharacterized protein n=1 Tax=Gordonia asplenii TaxID=2725283 RepID=A0A848KRS8_9ACTN|nr:hypothetical protein [Gordonia asplenii]NMO00799.1 hypothetical protein [Gordonia asplenii]
MDDQTHPADTAKVGDAFHDEDGVTWLLTDDGDDQPWRTSTWAKGRIWHARADACKRALTPLVPATATADGETAKYLAAMTRIADALRVAHGDRIDVDGLVRVAEAAAGALADREAALDAAAVGLPTPDASDPMWWRAAAQLMRNRPDWRLRSGDTSIALIFDREADRLDADAADRELAEQVAEDCRGNQWNASWEDVALAAIHAERDRAAKAGA